MYYSVQWGTCHDWNEPHKLDRNTTYGVLFSFLCLPILIKKDLLDVLQVRFGRFARCYSKNNAYLCARKYNRLFMKRLLALLTLGILFASSLQAQEADELPGELVRLNPEVIDSVEMIQDPNEYAFISYLIYYHQPLKHEAPELGSLPLRAMLTITYGSDYWDDMMQMHIGGYELDSTLVKAPNQTVSNRLGTSRAELMDKYGGHLLEPEHRFFGESCPEHPASLLGYCTAEEAAADFHALAEALKKVFKGKWAITGTSKGGGAAADKKTRYNLLGMPVGDEYRGITVKMK